MNTDTSSRLERWHKQHRSLWAAIFVASTLTWGTYLVNDTVKHHSRIDRVSDLLAFTLAVYCLINEIRAIARDERNHKLILNHVNHFNGSNR